VNVKYMHLVLYHVRESSVDIIMVLDYTVYM